MTSPYRIDLDAYFERILDEGSREPDLATLRRVIAAHVRAIPFENLDVLLGRGISLDPAAVERKLVHEQRGGYCFEQNSLLLQVLLALGYAAHPISVRVRMGSPREETPARTHLLVRVEIEGESWLADVGVGGLTPPVPLRLALDVRQENSHETRRIVADGAWSGFDQRAPTGRLFHQAWLGDEWSDVYDFTLEEMHPVDRELANWYTSTHPASKFRKQLLAARVTDEGRVTLLDRELKHRAADGAATSRTLRTDEELLAALADEFGLQLPAGTRFDCPGLASA